MKNNINIQKYLSPKRKMDDQFPFVDKQNRVLGQILGRRESIRGDTYIPQFLPLESKQPNGFGYENE